MLRLQQHYDHYAYRSDRRVFARSRANGRSTRHARYAAPAAAILMEHTYCYTDRSEVVVVVVQRIHLDSHHVVIQCNLWPVAMVCPTDDRDTSDTVRDTVVHVDCNYRRDRNVVDAHTCPQSTVDMHDGIARRICEVPQKEIT